MRLTEFATTPKWRLITRERQPLLASAELNHVWVLHFMCDTMCDDRAFQTLNVIDESNQEALRIDRRAAAGRDCHCPALIGDG